MGRVNEMHSVKFNRVIGALDLDNNIEMVCIVNFETNKRKVLVKGIKGVDLEIYQEPNINVIEVVNIVTNYVQIEENMV